MKKLVRTSLVNTPNRRGIKDLNIQFYSHDKNNAGFEFVIKNETDLSEYTARVLFHFVLSDSTWESAGTIEGNVVKTNFNTDLIARCEEVLGFLFLDSESNSLDVFKFKFNVVLSEIDKNEVEKRKIKHVADIEALELVTRSELRDELAKLQVTGGVDLSNYLTNTVAEEIYVKKTDLPAPYNDSALVQKIGQLEARVDNDTVYDDTALKERVTALESKAIAGGAYDDTHLRERLDTLEAKQDKDTVYDDAELKRRVTALEERPNVNTSDFVTTAVLESKGYLTTHQDISNFALKSEIPQPYNDSALVSRVQALETKQDNDTVYDDTKVKERLTALESKPTVDTSNFLTRSELNTLRPLPTLTINNNTLSISGGNSVKLPTNQWEIHGTGIPNGVVEAEIGTTYVDKNKTNGALKWIKTTNGGNTGWVVFTGDTGWRTLPLINKRGNAQLQIRRINDEVIVKFDGLQWGWFGVADMSRQDGNIVEKTIASKSYTWIKLNIGQGNNVLPAGFRSASSMLTGLYGDLGDLLGSVYVGGTSDSNAIQLRYAMGRNELNSNILSQIRISPITFITDDEWPLQLP